MPQVREILVAIHRIRGHVLSRDILILGDEAPSAVAEVPVHDGEGDDILEAFELAGNKRAVCLCRVVSTTVRVQDITQSTYPGTRVANIEMVAALLRRILGPGLIRDPVAERAHLAFELARLVGPVDPFGNFACLESQNISISQLIPGHPRLTILVCCCAVKLGRAELLGRGAEMLQEGFDVRRCAAETDANDLEVMTGTLALDKPRTGCIGVWTTKMINIKKTVGRGRTLIHGASGSHSMVLELLGLPTCI